jgi:superfamily II DNA/RNA helicase
MSAGNSAVPEQDLTGSPVSFAALGVPASLVDVLDEQGITAPFPVQAATLPDALAGRDILGRAQTGSGKTLGFSLPMVSRLAGGSTSVKRPRGLVLVPTRELATQVTEVLRPLAWAMDLRVATIYGGVSYGPQINALQRRTDIVVATPGRLADLIAQRECDLSDVGITVIDEADQMADLGFLPIVRRLLETTADGGQRMLFSATLDSAVDVLAQRFLTDPAVHSVDENSSPAEIEHHVLSVDTASRVAVITALAGGEKRSLVFTRTKHGAERLARQLTEAGIPAAELHGNLRQGARSRNLDAFASGLARVMVATDIAARGIHVDSIDLVIHADPPAEHKAYLHRSGRTARGGADGVVVTLQTKAQVRDVAAMMRKADITPHPVVVVDAESALLTEIAGPPAPRVSVSGKVAELVKPEDRLSSNSRPGVGKPWEGRPRRKGPRPSRDDRFSARGPRDAGPRHRDSAASRPGSRPEEGDRPARAERFGRDDRAPRYSREDGAARDERRGPQDRGRHGDDQHRERSGGFPRGERPGSDQRPDRGDRSGRDDRNPRSDRNSPAGRGQRREQGGNDWWPRPAGSGRTTPGGYRRPGSGSSWSPSTTSGRPTGRDDRSGNTRGNDSRNRDDRGRDAGPGRASRDDRSSRDDRPFRDDRAARNERSQPGSQSSRPHAGRPGRPPSGGPAGGSSRRSGNSAGRGAGGGRPWGRS